LVVKTGDAFRFGLGLGEGGEQERGQDGYDRNNDQQFDKGKGVRCWEGEAGVAVV
jgi:hypothetical protein